MVITTNACEEWYTPFRFSEIHTVYLKFDLIDIRNKRVVDVIDRNIRRRNPLHWMIKNQLLRLFKVW